jgi:hypothetical protein
VQGTLNGVPGYSRYSFSFPNEDAKKFFGEDFFEVPSLWDQNIQTTVWDRKSLYILSSITTSSDRNNFLGHTRGTEYIPIKYYRLDSDDKEFWVEFYST